MVVDAAGLRAGASESGVDCFVAGVQVIGNLFRLKAVGKQRDYFFLVLSELEARQEALDGGSGVPHRNGPHHPLQQDCAQRLDDGDWTILKTLGLQIGGQGARQEDRRLAWAGIDVRQE